MNRKTYYVLAVVLVIVSLFVASRLFATNGPWIYMGREDYRLVPSGNGNFVVFNTLQDIDARKIMEARSGIMTESGVEIMPEGKNVNITFEEMRGKIIPALRFNAITPENTLVELSKKETFEIPSPWKNRGQAEEKLKIIRLHLNEKNVLSEDEPEFSRLICSPDGTKYLIWDERGLWVLWVDKNDSVKISSDTYNGKTYDELIAELRDFWRSKRADGPVDLEWNAHPIFSPDSSKIVYITNRDCMTGGASLWIYDFATRGESSLIRGKDNTSYECEGWLDDTHFVVHEYDIENNKYSYLIADTNGRMVSLNLKGKDPYVLCVSNKGLIAYEPDPSESRDIAVIKISNDGSITEPYSKTLNAGESFRVFSPEVISPNGMKIAYMYTPDGGYTNYLVIVDLKTCKETLIKEAPTKEKIYNFCWLDDNRLLIHADKVTNGMHEVSSWIYKIR